MSHGRRNKRVGGGGGGLVGEVKKKGEGGSERSRQWSALGKKRMSFRLAGRKEESV